MFHQILNPLVTRFNFLKKPFSVVGWAEALYRPEAWVSLHEETIGIRFAHFKGTLLFKPHR